MKDISEGLVALFAQKMLSSLKIIRDKNLGLSQEVISNILKNDNEISNILKSIESDTNLLLTFKNVFKNLLTSFKKYLKEDDIELILGKVEKLNAHNFQTELSDIMGILLGYYSEYENILEKVYKTFKLFALKFDETKSKFITIKERNLELLSNDNSIDENILEGIKGFKSTSDSAVSVDELKKTVEDFVAQVSGILEEKIYAKRKESKNIEKDFIIFNNDLSSYRDHYDELKQELEEYRRQSITDDLTGLYRKNHMYAVLKKLKISADMSDGTFFVIMSDIDRFKDVNDTYGHLAGDNVLKHFGKIIQECLPPEATAFRYGGEEFLIVFANNDHNQAFELAKTINLKMQNTKFKLKNDVKTITVSLGIGKYKKGEDVKTTIDRADRNLYMAKANGRNCIYYNSKRV